MRLIKIKEIKIKPELYPRANPKGVWQTIVSYSTAMKAGSIFPPIAVAKLGEEYVLVDGLHRLKASELNKEELIQAEILTGLNEKEIYVEAIKRNTSHGLSLNYYEKLIAIKKLQEMGLQPNAITELVHIPMGELQRNVSSRLVITSSGEEIISKKGMINSNANTIELETLNKGNLQMHGDSQVKLLEQIIFLIENGLIDLKRPPVKRLFAKLTRLLLPKVEAIA